MDLTYRLDPELTPGLLDRLTRLWVDVNNAGGAVGFVGTTSYEDVRPGVDGYAESIAAGRHRLLPPPCSSGSIMTVQSQA